MRIENLTVSHRDGVIFNNFNLEILDGQITSILGASGAGKTTLLNAVLESAKKQNLTVSYAFQEPRLISHLSVLENLKLIGYEEAEILNALKKVGLQNKINAYPNHLSGGEKQRVNFARAFLFDSSVILLDEPFSSLDVKLKISLINLLVSEKQGKTIIFVTHEIDEALMLSNKIVLIENGKIKLELKIDKDFNKREYGKMNAEREILISAMKH